MPCAIYSEGGRELRELRKRDFFCVKFTLANSEYPTAQRGICTAQFKFRTELLINCAEWREILNWSLIILNWSLIILNWSLIIPNWSLIILNWSLIILN